MISRKLIESTTGDLSQSWTTRWTIFIAGWWRSSLRAMRMPWANIPTLRPAPATKIAFAFTAAASRGRGGVALRRRWLHRALALLVSMGLLGAASLEATVTVAPASPSAAAQTAHRKKKKSGKAKTAPCRTGCTPSTSAPEITSAGPEDEAAQRDLSALARALHNAAPGAYERLAAFAGKNASNVW